MEQDTTPILAQMMQWFLFEDIEQFRNELSLMLNALQKASDPVRQKMLGDGEIREVEYVATDLKIGAIDCASVPVSIGEVSSIISLAVHYRQNKEPKHIGNRKTGFNDEAFRHMAVALRLHGELSLMAEAEEITIADNSWWSYLMDANKLITAYEGLKDSEGRKQFEDLYQECFQKQTGLFVRAAYNPNIIAMSKTGSSKSTYKRPGYAQFFDAPVSDLALFSNILLPGEYTKPRLLKDATDASFGVEQRGWNEADAKRIRARFENRDGFHVTFFKPHPYKKAYRIEFPYETFGQKENLMHLLSAICEETKYHDIVEPVPQLYADRLTKQVSAMSKMYGMVNMPDFAELLFATRT